MTKKRKTSFRGKVNADGKKQNMGGSGYLSLPKGVEIYTPTPGKTESFDVIPYIVTDKNHLDKDIDAEIALVGEPWYKKTIKVHKQVGAENKTVVCLATFGKKCPICEDRKELELEEDGDEDLIKSLYPKIRALYVIIPKDIKKLEEDFHILDMSTYLFQKHIYAETSENEKYENFPSLEEGYTLKVRWSKESLCGHSYAEAGRIDFKKRKKPYSEDILETVPNLDTLLIEMSYKAMKALYFEMETEEDEEDKKESSKQKNSKEKKKSTKKSSKKKEEIPLEWSEIEEMIMGELIDVISIKKLEIDPDEHEDIHELRKAIAEEMDIEVPEKKKKESTKKPGKKKEVKKETKKKPEKNKCPHGHKFGVDTDEKKACDDCESWDDCTDKKEE